MVMGAPQLVTGMPRTPNPYGLFTVVTPREQGESHWEGSGVEWESLPCRNAAGIGSPDCDPDTTTVGLPKNFSKGGPVLNTASPFTVYAPYECSPVGHTVEEAQEMATQQLLAEEQNYVEWELWSGHLGSAPTLPGSAEPVADGPLDPLVALAALEAWYHGHAGTVNGQLGYIHMGVGAATILAKKAALQYRNNAVYTSAGSRVIIGTGYGSAALSGDGTVFTDRLYITPPLFAYRSEIFTSSDRPGDLLDRRTNDLYAVAERTYLVGWDDCPHSGTVELAECALPDCGTGTLPTPEYPFTIEQDETHPAGSSFGIHGTGRPGATVTGTSVASPSGTRVDATPVTVGDAGGWQLLFNMASEDTDNSVEVTAQQGLRTVSSTITLT